LEKIKEKKFFRKNLKLNLEDGNLHLKTWFKFLFGNRLGPYVPTTKDICEDILKCAKLNSNDLVYDLGCGVYYYLINRMQDY
jgi:hypothetical protein